MYVYIFQYADSTQVLVTSSNAGSVNFVNSAFWGPSNQIAKVYILASASTLFYETLDQIPSSCIIIMVHVVKYLQYLQYRV